MFCLLRPACKRPLRRRLRLKTHYLEITGFIVQLSMFPLIWAVFYFQLNFIFVPVIMLGCFIGGSNLTIKGIEKKKSLDKYMKDES